MHITVQRQLIERVLSLSEQGITDMDPDVSAIPTHAFYNTDRFQREQRHLFRRFPLVVGRSSQLRNGGDFITHDESGVPLLITRDSSGELHAFINACRHRGTQLVTERKGVQSGRIVCPYHAWSYNGAGKLVNIPHAYGFSPQQDRCLDLVELPLQEKFGFLWVIPTPNQPLDVETYLGEALCNDFENFDLANQACWDERTFARPVNWKLAVDTFLENYHVQKAHQNSINRFFYPNLGLYEQFGYHSRNVYAKRSIAELASQPQAQWKLREHANLLYFIFPNTFILVEPDHIGLAHAFPSTLKSSVVLSSTLLPELPESEKSKAYFALNNKILYDALEEDFEMAARVQATLESGANDRFIHGRFEKALKYFHKSVDSVLNDSCYIDKDASSTSADRVPKP